MSVKLIAVDMDGTFLNDKKTYNRERFRQQYARMKEQQIRFVVASGNQYYQLASFFPEIVDEIGFVAENGGWVRDAGEDVFNCSMPRDHFQQIVAFLQTRPEIEIIACGKQSAYTLKHYDPRFHDIAVHYYHRLELVENFDNLDDTILKFASDIGMVPIPIRREKAGYVLNSLLVPLLNAAAELAEGGYANPHDVDKVWRIATGAPMGPFQIYDMIGLNTPYNILSHGDEHARSLAAWLKENYIDKGKLGIASGEGFYSYKPAD